MHGAGVAHEVFARRPDGADLDVAPFAVADGAVGFLRVLPPQVGGGFDLGAVLVHPQVNGLGGAPGNGDGLEAAALLGGGEHAAEGGVEKQAGQRRFRAGTAARGAGDGGVGGGANGKDDHVFRRQGIDARGQALVQQTNGETVAAEVLPGKRFVERFDGNVAAAQIDIQYAPVVSVHGILR